MTAIRWTLEERKLEALTSCASFARKPVKVNAAQAKRWEKDARASMG